VRTLAVVGARPNFVKMAPVLAELRRRFPGGRHVLVHTGQHYDRLMSDVFLAELDVPRPDHLLGVGSGSHAVQTARVMERLEPIVDLERPDVVIVPGDVNSTLAAALVAAKLDIPVAHVEAGLRSFDRSMPEEINRVLVDHVSDHLLVHCEEAVENLRREGVDGAQVALVGNTMIDSLRAVEPRFRAAGAARRLGLPERGYLLVTLHRPALVDGPLLAPVMQRLCDIGRDMPVLFPVHPRTRRRLEALDVTTGVQLVDPVGYLDFLSLQADAAAILTDSGGVQEESTCLGVPCFTLRANTERPVTVRAGTNTLLGLEPERIADILPAVAAPFRRDATIPPLWDGRAAERAGDVLERALAPGSVALA
jgi:UDP-N-acetylglucosamine 2-epimerase (non-hydrolysing)